MHFNNGLLKFLVSGLSFKAQGLMFWLKGLGIPGLSHNITFITPSPGLKIARAKHPFGPRRRSAHCKKRKRLFERVEELCDGTALADGRAAAQRDFLSTASMVAEATAAEATRAAVARAADQNDATDAIAQWSRAEFSRHRLNEWVSGWLVY